VFFFLGGGGFDLQRFSDKFLIIKNSSLYHINVRGSALVILVTF